MISESQAQPSKKVGTILSSSLLQAAKSYAKRRHTSLNRVFTDALQEFLKRHAQPEPKLSSVKASFGVFRLPGRVVRLIAQEDVFGAE